MSEKFRRELSNRHYQVYLAALAVMFVHLLEDAFVHKENGSSLGAQFGSAALTVLLFAVGAGLYPLLGRRARPLLPLVFGALGLVAGWRAHVSHAIDEGPSGGDYTGILYTLAGAVLIALALKLAADLLRGRPEPAPR